MPLRAGATHRVVLHSHEHSRPHARAPHSALANAERQGGLPNEGVHGAFTRIDAKARGAVRLRCDDAEEPAIVD